MKLSYDVIYNIYMICSDYNTLINLSTLDKEFYYNYISKYNSSFKHKFDILNDEFFELFKCNILTTGVSHQTLVNKTQINDIKFIYNFYKRSIYNYLVNLENLKYINNFYVMLGNMIILQGKNHIYNTCNITVNKKKIKIYIPTTNENIAKILSFNKFISYRFLMQKLELFDNLLN